MLFRSQRLRIVLLLTSLTSSEQIVAGAGVDDVAALEGRRVAYQPGTDGELLLRATLAAADLPIKKIIGGKHFISDLTLPHGRVLFDYLKDA